MKSILQYLSGILGGIGLGILSMYYLGVSGKYVQSTALLTTLVVLVGINFIALGIVAAVWCVRKYRN